MSTCPFLRGSSKGYISRIPAFGQKLGLGQRLPIMAEHQKLKKKKKPTDSWTPSQNRGMRPRSVYFLELSQLPGRWLRNTALNLWIGCWNSIILIHGFTYWQGREGETEERELFPGTHYRAGSVLKAFFVSSHCIFTTTTWSLKQCLPSHFPGRETKLGEFEYGPRWWPATEKILPVPDHMLVQLYHTALLWPIQ